jgi:hypothetical protein
LPGLELMGPRWLAIADFFSILDTHTDSLPRLSLAPLTLQQRFAVPDSTEMKDHVL